MLSLVEAQGAERHVFVVKLFSFLKDGHHGVDVFFIISGFLMGRIITRNSFSYRAFVRARIIRVYPAFFLSLVVCAYYYSRQYGLNVNTKDFIGNMLFLNAVNEFNVIPYNSVSWSLGYEFAFYLIIPSALLFPAIPQRFKAATALGLVIAFIPLPFIRMTGMFAGYFIASWSDETLKKVGRLPVWPPLLAYSAIVLLKRANLISYMEFYYSFLVLGGLLFVQIAFGENRLSRLFQAPILRVLGTISYSFYLLHYACIIVAFEHITPKGLPVGLSFVVLTISSLSLAIACAFLSWHMFERPYFGKKGKNASSTPRVKDVPDAVDILVSRSLIPVGVEVEVVAATDAGRRKSLPINPGDNALKRRADVIRPSGTLVPADASE